MRRFGAFVLPAGATLLLLALGSNNAAALVQALRPSSADERGLIIEAKIECGMFDGKFQCRAVSGGKQFGKSAGPGDDAEKEGTSPEAAPGGLMPGPDAGQAVPSILTHAKAAWSARRPTANVRRIRNCWAAIASATPLRHAATGSQWTPSRKPAAASRKNSPANCARTD